MSEYLLFLFFYLGRGGGGGGGVRGEGGQVAVRYEHQSPHIFYTQHIVTISTTELHGLMKKFLMVINIEGIVALTIKGR